MSSEKIDFDIVYNDLIENFDRRFIISPITETKLGIEIPSIICMIGWHTGYDITPTSATKHINCNTLEHESKTLVMHDERMTAICEFLKQKYEEEQNFIDSMINELGRSLYVYRFAKNLYDEFGVDIPEEILNEAIVAFKLKI